MSIVLSMKDHRTELGAILLDCLLTEEIDFQSQVTLYPVEDGGPDVSDHITQGNKRVRISGVMSTADISGGFGFSSLFGYAEDNSTKFVSIVEAVEGMYKARAMLDIATAQMLYKNMAFTSLNITRSADGMGGNWANIKAELIEVRKVKLKTSDVPAPETTAEPAKGRSGQTNKPAGKTSQNAANKPAAPERGKSAAKLIDKATGFTSFFK